MARKDNDSSHGSVASGDGASKKKKAKNMASMMDTLRFIFDCGLRVQFLFFMGICAAIAHGLVFPFLAYLFSTSFSGIAGAAANGLEEVRRLAFTFLIVGTYALFVALWQTWCFEVVAYYASQNFRLKWFNALLRQDPAFFDVYDVGGIAAQVGSNANKFRRGIGRKFGEGFQFFTTGVGGLAFALYSSWKVALVVLAIVPLAGIAAVSVLQLNQSKGTRAAKSYKQAGGVAYAAVSAIKTVLSLDALKDMIAQYNEATGTAYNDAVKVLAKQGLAVGCMMGSFFLFYFVLTIYGTFLLYREIRSDGCDPSGVVLDNVECGISSAGVFGAMLGIAFSAQGISQVGNFTECLAATRVATYEALIAINRKPGSPEHIIYRSDDDDDMSSTSHSKRPKSEATDNELTTHSKKSKTGNGDVENGDMQEIKAILPKFDIDSSSKLGLKPDIIGALSFRDVFFAYPTRPHDPVLKGLSVDIEAGKTIAFVGPSGGGKSTVISMIERFYDPISGTVSLDGVNLKDINLTHLRRMIGYVGQEPALFATTIRGNIKYGNPHATQEQIEEAARLANAHDFITNFSDGYDTQVGDKGSQLSGGQKQRIAIARVLVGNPRILLLDEATSALDAESELVVQDALDKIVDKKRITTIIIAHRLSTIRNADVINVIVSGRVAEQGTHDELMKMKSYYFKLVQKQEGQHGVQEAGDEPTSSTNIPVAPENLDATEAIQSLRSKLESTPHIEFRDVTFSYPARPKKKIFKKFNLIVEKGQTVALVGPSGGGKSTTVGLIERFYDPSEGEILYCGVDLRALNVSWYRSQISYVGQEPVLFNMTIAENIAFGLHGVSRAEIEEAARQANAHDFILDLPEGYETLIGARGIMLSGGQKQRVAIARALVRKPQCLILDEATSALDNESESIVQEAINRLMSANLTVVVIAHRLSTIRNADKIAVIDDGKVIEFGSHDELVQKPDGRYKRLFDSSKRQSTMKSMGLKSNADKKDKTDIEDEEINWEDNFKAEEEKAFDLSRARRMAAPDTGFILIGIVGALIAGSVFPVMGVLFSKTIALLFYPVSVCPATDGSIPLGYSDCSAYFNYVATSMREQSFKVAGYWVGLLFSVIIGNVLAFWGFGTASERLNKRIRDTAFAALLRQEVGFFDKRSVGSITSQLQDDASKIHAFSGEPIRSTVIAVASLLIGLTLAFVHMWQFALLAIGCVPVMGFATAIHMKQFIGEDEGDLNSSKDELNSPGGVIVETLLNIRTVSALTLENRRFKDYQTALHKSEPNYKIDAFMTGLTGGLSMFIQQWVNGLQIWFGSWLLNRFSYYTFEDFLIANFGVLFCLMGLGTAFQDMSDKKEVEKSAGRIFYLLDRKSEIDPLSDDGKKL